MAEAITTFPIHVGGSSKYFPAVSGSYVSWRDNSSGNICLYDIVSHDLSIIGSAASNTGTASNAEFGPNMGGDYVVWEDTTSGDRKIYAYNVNTATSIIIGQNLGSYTATAKTDGKIAVWQDNLNIRAYDLLLNTSMVAPDGNKGSRPDVYNDIIVWQTGDIYTEDIYGERISSGEKFPICTDPGGQGRPGISGNFVVCQSNYDNIFAHNLVTGEEFILNSTTSGGWPARHFCAISWNVVVWQDNRNGDYDIYGYDLVAREEFPIYVGPGDQLWPAIDGSLVVWSDGSYGLYGAYVENVPEPSTWILIIIGLILIAVFIYLHHRNK